MDEHEAKTDPAAGTWKTLVMAISFHICVSALMLWVGHSAATFERYSQMPVFPYPWGVMFILLFFGCFIDIGSMVLVIRGSSGVPLASLFFYSLALAIRERSYLSLLPLVPDNGLTRICDVVVLFAVYHTAHLLTPLLWAPKVPGRPPKEPDPV